MNKDKGYLTGRSSGM